MLRGRHDKSNLHPGDKPLCSTEEYLERAAAAANRIADQLNAGAQG
jgi:hypothetical protein